MRLAEVHQAEVGTAPLPKAAAVVRSGAFAIAGLLAPDERTSDSPSEHVRYVADFVAEVGDDDSGGAAARTRLLMR